MRLIKVLIIAAVQIVFGLLLVHSVAAQTISVEVSDNGEGSSNATNVAVTNETNIQSQNTAQVANAVNSSANTGGNNANTNSGDAQIKTGNITQAVDTDNNLNTNNINIADCKTCSANLEIKNSENGANSQNTVNTEISNTVNVLAVNDARITNNVAGISNSGKNEANDNVGNVKIDTGDVKVAGRISNLANRTVISDPSGDPDIKIINSANGTNSVNDVNIQISNILNFEKIDIWQLENNLVWTADSGGNSCVGNVGDCEIATGDVDINFNVANAGNFDFVFIGAGKPPTIVGPEPGVPGQPTTPSQPSAPSPAGPTLSPGPSPGPSQVLAVLAQLPVTGPVGIIWLFVFWISLFLTGVVLRKLGNRSPPIHLAFLR